MQVKYNIVTNVFVLKIINTSAFSGLISGSIIMLFYLFILLMLFWRGMLGIVVLVNVEILVC